MPSSSSSSADDEILFHTSGPIAIITLNLPKKLNALTQGQYFRLAQLLRKAADMEEIYVTILTGKGRFFSAGANVQAASHRDSTNTNTSTSANENAEDSSSDPDDAHRRSWVQSFLAHNIEIGQAFSTHPKILVAALNGPAVGLSAALVAYADFVYAMPHAFLLTPFSSLGLVAEGGASATFVQRLGTSKANEALIMSRRISCEELLQTGFVNKVFEGKPGDDEAFLKMVLEEVDQRLTGGHLNPRSLLKIKELIRRPGRAVDESQHMAEVMVGLDGFVKNIPQQEFAKVASGAKRHKL